MYITFDLKLACYSSDTAGIIPDVTSMKVSLSLCSPGVFYEVDTISILPQVSSSEGVTVPMLLQVSSTKVTLSLSCSTVCLPL